MDKSMVQVQMQELIDMMIWWWRVLVLRQIHST